MVNKWVASDKDLKDLGFNKIMFWEKNIGEAFQICSDTYSFSIESRPGVKPYVWCNIAPTSVEHLSEIIRTFQPSDYDFKTFKT